MHDAPSPERISAAVADFLRQRIVPALGDGAADAALAYHARVAANLLDIARRQLAEDPAVAAQERQRLQALLSSEPAAALDADRGADLGALNAALARAIAEGRLGLHTPGLADHLWAVTLAKLAVDQPAYAGYRRQIEPPPGD